MQDIAGQSNKVVEMMSPWVVHGGFCQNDLQPELLNGILASVQLCRNDTKRCKHGKAAVVDFSLLRQSSLW